MVKKTATRKRLPKGWIVDKATPPLPPWSSTDSIPKDSTRVLGKFRDIGVCVTWFDPGIGIWLCGPSEPGKSPVFMPALVPYEWTRIP